MAETKAVKTDVVESVASDVVFVSLHSFADQNALKYGVELMGGFVHAQEAKNQYANTEEEWHKAIQAFAKEGVE